MIQEAFEAGAWGYLLKTARPKEILETVRAVHRDQRQLLPLVGDSSGW